MRLAAQARDVLEREGFDLIAVTGGQTAVALYRALEAERIDLVGAPGPGLALGYLRAPKHPALPILTKAGGFGAPDLFVSLLREVSV
jgi:D-threonate/D-erythronate kinase